MPSGVAAARTINTATVVVFSRSFVVVVVFLLQIFFSLFFLLRKNTPAMNEEAKGHKCVCYYWLSACLQCLLAVTETETHRERRGGEDREREREKGRRERLGNDVVSSVLESAEFTRRL